MTSFQEQKTVWPEDITEEQKKLIIDNDYFLPKIVGGQLCALKQFFTTIGLCVDLTEFSTGRRYCYPDIVEALIAMENYSDPNEHASGQWIKCKGKHKGEIIDLLNPEFGKDIQ